MGEKQSTHYIQHFLGLNSDWKKGGLPIRQWEKTRELTQQLWQLAKLPDNITHFDTRSSEYGIRDSLNLQIVREIQDLHQENSNKKAQNPAHDKSKGARKILAYCEQLEGKFGLHLFNPFLRLVGFDGHRDTPVETLHVVLLGVVKYLYRDAMESISKSLHPNILAHWHAFSSAGLNTAPIQPTTMVNHYKSLLGKDFGSTICFFTIPPS
ncbi:hypothetical protein CROQUDRAFT_692742 [Cronartium quercuum f. sp. fusiforme G11]|uniref:Uncharacterized protein n=1 Tax=Cronartium quercuum f. sp. fusiforme G11 TaxID=708437 RepID=A0A9P6TED8_9BASI|nr:hypothetical protein CROQUDRAFT_692742 [Cronartium quercuum f. sp. fusiforme G11]